MSIVAALTKKWNYSVEGPGAGRLVYREGNREYTFAVYEENGDLVLVGAPSSERIYYFFNWYWHPHEFSPTARARILPRIQEHLRAEGARVRVFERAEHPGLELDFYPELFGHRDEASQLLAAAGFAWLTDYGSIEILHEDYGLEICGIQNDVDINPMAEAMRRGFPHWHHQRVSLHDYGREPGWMVSISMFPSRPCNSGWYDAD